MRYRALPKVKLRRNRDGSTTWWAEWYECARGDRKHRSMVLGDGRKLSKAQARERLETALADEAPTSGTWTVERFVREIWLPPRLKRCYATARGSKSVAEAHIIPAFGHMRLMDVRKHDVEEWVAAMAANGYSKATTVWNLTHLRNMFREAVENDSLTRNPADRVKLTELPGRAETQSYSESEIRFLLAQPGKDGLILRLMLLCGLRPGEVLALEPGDVDGRMLRVDESLDNSGVVKRTKTGVVRTVPLSPLLAAELAALAGATEPGRRLFMEWGSVTYLQVKLKARFAGIVPGFCLRRCRTTCATEYRGDVADVQALLGHAQAEMTLERYRRAVPERMAQSVEELESRMRGAVQ